MGQFGGRLQFAGRYGERWRGQFGSGAPDTFDAGDTSTAWAPTLGGAFEYLNVGFTTPAAATGVIIREVAGQGSVLRVDLVESSGTAHTIWSGTDPSSSSDQPVDFVLSFPATSYSVAQIIVYVNGQNSPAIDAIGLVTTGSPSSLSVSTQGYDDSGNYNVTTYNSSGQVTSIDTYVNGVETQTTSNTYTSGVLSASDVTDVASGSVTHTTYDSNGYPTAVTLAYGTGSASTTNYEYSATGQLLQVIDANSNETDYTYNEAGQELTEATPLSATAMTMTYNGQDQLVSETNANGLINTYTYTDGNLTEEKWYASDGTTLLDTLDWSYNAAGQITSASNGNGTYTYTYNAASQLIGVSEPFSVSLSFGYDLYGNRDLVEDSFGDVEQSLYNSSGQLLSRTLQMGLGVSTAAFGFHIHAAGTNRHHHARMATSPALIWWRPQRTPMTEAATSPAFKVAVQSVRRPMRRGRLRFNLRRNVVVMGSLFLGGVNRWE